MISFGNISNIDVNNPKTWDCKFFLTFDIDWANEEIVNYTIDLVEKYDVPAAWFITHSAPFIERLRSNPKFELGIHPNFNNLLVGDTSNGKNPEEVIDRLVEIVPEARLVRSHSLAQSERIFDIFIEKKLSFVCNTFIPMDYHSIIKPWNLWNGIKVIPHSWQDNVSLKMKTIEILEAPKKSLNVLDFHPIHIFLNTENEKRYESSRKFHQKPKNLVDFKFDGYGVESKLLELLELNQGLKFEK